MTDPYPYSSLHAVGIPWIKDKIRSHCDFVQLYGEEKLGQWINWALYHGFLYLWPDPPTLGIIGRPVSRELIYNHSQIPEEELLCIFDAAGDGLWVDFLWAPYQWNTVMKFLRLTGKRWVGWQHKNTKMPHIRSISDHVEIHKTVDIKSPLLKHFA